MPATDSKVGAGDTRDPAHVVVNSQQVLFGLRNVGAIGQEVVDDKLRTGRGREEARGDVGCNRNRRGEKANNHGNGQISYADRSTQKCAIPAHPKRLCLVGFGSPRPQKKRAIIRRQPNRHQPGEQQRDHDRPKQRSRVFACVIGRQAHRRKGQKPNNRTTQQRPARLRDNGLARFGRCLAILNTHQRAFDNNNRVIDKHPKRDDQSAKRDPLHIKAVQVHSHQRPRDRDQ